MAKKNFTVQPGHTIAVSDPETKKVRWLKGGDVWDFEDDADTAEFVTSGALAPTPEAPPPADAA